MPKYKYHLSNGKFLTLEGDTPPTDDEVESLAKEQKVTLQPTTDTTVAPSKPIQDKIVNESKPESEPQSSWLSKAWHSISEPLTDAPSRFAKSVSDYIDSPSLDRSPTSAFIHGGIAGGVQGLGDVISGMTSPINLGTAALTGGASLAENAGMQGIANAARMGGRIASAPVVAHGASQVLSPESSLGERGFGLAEIAGGLAGMKEHVPSIESNISSEIPKSIETPVSKPSVPLGQTVIIKSENMNPKLYKQALEQGYEFQGTNDQGHFRLKKTSEGLPQPILESDVGSSRPTASGERQQLGPEIDAKKASIAAEAINFPRTIMSSMDMSAPLRQGIGLIHKPEFWKSFIPMFKAWGSEEAFNQVQQSIADKPLFKQRPGPGGKTLPSFAQDAGLKLTDLHSISTREESMMSSIAEKVPGVRPSNRAYVAFLNKLRADTFESLIDQGKVFGADGTTNIPLARELANFINNASGRGNLGKLETSAKALSTVFFSPRLIASRVQMLNPQNYVMGNPMVRKEYLKSLFAIAAAGNMVTQLGRLAGGTVEPDMASADFGKLKVGNTRLDPYAGFQQYIVAAQRLMPHLDSLGLGGMMKSTQTGIKYNLGQPKFGQSTRADVASRFARGKVNPVLGFAWSLASGMKEPSGESMNFTTANPMHNSITQRFIPMVMQDLYEIGSQQPENLPWAGPAALFGSGVQQYGNLQR